MTHSQLTDLALQFGIRPGDAAYSAVLAAYAAGDTLANTVDTLRTCEVSHHTNAFWSIRRQTGNGRAGVPVILWARGYVERDLTGFVTTDGPVY